MRFCTTKGSENNHIMLVTCPIKNRCTRLCVSVTSSNYTEERCGNIGGTDL